MVLNIIFSVIFGVVWLNLLVLVSFKSGIIYKFMTRKGVMKEKFDQGSHRWLWLLGIVVVIYLTLSDLLVLGYNRHTLPIVLLLNVFLMLVLLIYNNVVINNWLVVVVRPMMLGISKLMTPVTIKSYTRFTWIFGGAASIMSALVAGWIYLIINQLMR